MEQNQLPTKAIVDSQSVKNTDSTSKSQKGYDGGKKVGGIKRHLITDMNGLPLAIEISPANQSERDNCHYLLMQDENELIKDLDTVYGDGGYSGERFRFEIYQDTGIMMEIVPRNKDKEIQKKQSSKYNPKGCFQVVPKRWIVERSFAWLDKCRRLWKNTEKLIETSKSMVELCFIRLLVRRLAKFGLGG